MEVCLITIISMEIYQNGTQVLSQTYHSVSTLNHDLLIVLLLTDELETNVIFLTILCSFIISFGDF